MIRPRLKFVLDWDDDPTANGISAAYLHVNIDDDPIWPVQGDSEARIDLHAEDLLSHLSWYWAILLLRQEYPLPVRPLCPSQFVPMVENRWAQSDLTEAELDSESELLEHFVLVHDLSRAFRGVSGLPSLWLMRQGSTMLVETGRVYRADFNSAVESLNQLGDQIAERLITDHQQRWSKLVSTWNARDISPAERLTALSASVPDDRAARLCLSQKELAVTSVNAAMVDTPLRIAARMSGTLPEDEAAKVLEHLFGITSNPAQQLVEISEAARKWLSLNHQNDIPHLQGEGLAIWLRNQLNLAPTSPVDIEEILRNLCVECRLHNLSPNGLAIWNLQHGPGISIKSGDPNARRVTLAHELCHLLVDISDQTNSMLIVDLVKGGRMPDKIEKRAKSFAGEFMLPTAAAASRWKQAGRPSGTERLDELIRSLREDYGVTRQVASWKIEHAAKIEQNNLSAVLDSLDPGRRPRAEI